MTTTPTPDRDLGRLNAALDGLHRSEFGWRPDSKAGVEIVAGERFPADGGTRARPVPVTVLAARAVPVIDDDMRAAEITAAELGWPATIEGADREQRTSFAVVIGGRGTGRDLLVVLHDPKASQ